MLTTTTRTRTNKKRTRSSSLNWNHKVSLLEEMDAQSDNDNDNDNDNNNNDNEDNNNNYYYNDNDNYDAIKEEEAEKEKEKEIQKKKKNVKIENENKKNINNNNNNNVEKNHSSNPADVKTEDLLGIFATAEDIDGKRTPSDSLENKKHGHDLLDNDDHLFESFDEAFVRRNPQQRSDQDSLSENSLEDQEREKENDNNEIDDHEYYRMHHQFHSGGGGEKEKAEGPSLSPPPPSSSSTRKNKSKLNMKKNSRQYVVDYNKSQAKARNSEPIKVLTDQTSSSTIPERKFGVNLNKKDVGMRVRSDSYNPGDDLNELAKKKVLALSPPTLPAPQVPTAAATVEQEQEQEQEFPISKERPLPPPPKVQAPKPPVEKYDCLAELRRGTALLKYGKQGYPHFRQFNLSENNDKLVWFSKRKKLEQSFIRIKDITEVLSGQHTKEFQRISWTSLEPASFSIWYNGHRQSLNLVAKSIDEMQMWVDGLRILQAKANRGEDLSKLKSLEVTVDFRDRNRPQSRKNSGNFLRSNETKDKEVNPSLHRQLIYDLASITKLFHRVRDLSQHETVQKSYEAVSINQILSELEERIEELREEVTNTRNTKIAENDVWRTRIDLEALKEKISVLIKTNNKKPKRRFSVF